MVFFQDIEVRVVSSSSGRPVVEYQDPEAVQSLDNFVVNKFLVVVTGWNYQVEVLVRPDFQLWDADGLIVSINLHGNVVTKRLFVERNLLEHYRNTGKPLVFDTVLYQEGSAWCTAPITFGSLNTGKSFKI